MTQTPLSFMLPDRIAAWARCNDGAPFCALTDAMGVGREDGPTTSDVDVAAVTVGALRWGVRGYEVGMSTEGELR